MNINRLDAKLELLSKSGRKALVAFLTAGFPDEKTTEELVPLLAEEGADIIELGVPFSDPVADGPTIQYSSEQALRRGTHLAGILSLVRKIREKCDVPIVLMGYLNPFFHYGIGKFVQSARESGVDGCIIPDLIHDEAGEIKRIFSRAGVSLIFLAAPNTPAGRLGYIGNESTPFVYVVSLTGVTGGRKALSSGVRKFLSSTKRHIRNKSRYLGFGISNAAQVKQLKDHTDGIIVGSALIEIVRDNSDAPRRNKKIASLIRSLRTALDK